METLKLGNSPLFMPLNLSDWLIQLVLFFFLNIFFCFDVELSLKGKINFFINGKADFIKINLSYIPEYFICTF